MNRYGLLGRKLGHSLSKIIHEYIFEKSNIDATYDLIELEEDEILDKDDENYIEYDSYQYELGRKVPFIIWTKDMKGTSLNITNPNVMGMYDVMPTLGNMFGFYNQYQHL